MDLRFRNPDLIDAILERLTDGLVEDLHAYATTQAHRLGINPDTARRTINDLETFGAIRRRRTLKGAGPHELTNLGAAWRTDDYTDVPTLEPHLDPDTGEPTGAKCWGTLDE